MSVRRLLQSAWVLLLILFPVVSSAQLGLNEGAASAQSPAVFARFARRKGRAHPAFYGAATVDLHNFKASGSTLFTQGQTTAGSTNVVLAGPIDFANGEGIEIDHVGPPCVINRTYCANLIPTAPAVVPQGTAGRRRYDYFCQYVSPWTSIADPGGGITPKGRVATVFNGSALLSQTAYNQVTCATQPGAAAYLPWRSTDGGVTWQALPMSYGPVLNDRGYEPAIYQGNGLPDWRSGGSNVLDPNWVPASPNTSALADNFVSTIQAGAGTTRLTLGSAPQVTLTTARIHHSDDQAFAAADRAAYLTNLDVPRTVLTVPIGRYNLYSTFNYHTEIVGVPGAFITWYNGMDSVPAPSVLVSYALGDALEAAPDGGFESGLGIQQLAVTHQMRVGATLGSMGNFGGAVEDVVLVGSQYGYNDHGLGTDNGAHFSHGAISNVEVGVNFTTASAVEFDDFYVMGVNDNRRAPYEMHVGFECNGAINMLSFRDVTIWALSDGGIGLDRCEPFTSINLQLGYVFTPGVPTTGVKTASSISPGSVEDVMINTQWLDPGMTQADNPASVRIVSDSCGLLPLPFGE